MAATSDLGVDLNTRRKLLGMSVHTLSERSGVSTATVNRVLRGDADQTAFGNVRAIARAVGIEIEARPRNVGLFAAFQAKGKAERIVNQVQASSALEKQAVGKGDYRKMVRRTAKELLRGPRRRLWSK